LSALEGFTAEALAWASDNDVYTLAIATPLPPVTFIECSDLQEWTDSAGSDDEWEAESVEGFSGFMLTNPVQEETCCDFRFLEGHLPVNVLNSTMSHMEIFHHNVGDLLVSLTRNKRVVLTFVQHLNDGLESVEARQNHRSVRRRRKMAYNRCQRNIAKPSPLRTVMFIEDEVENVAWGDNARVYPSGHVCLETVEW
jgi:hypothetical protein